MLHVLKPELFITETSSNICQVRGNGNLVQLLCCLHVQLIINTNYSSYNPHLIKLLHLLLLQPIINSFHNLTLVVTERSTLTPLCFYDIYLVLVNIRFHKFYSVASLMSLAENTATNNIWAFISCGSCLQKFSLYPAATWHNVT